MFYLNVLNSDAYFWIENWVAFEIILIIFHILFQHWRRNCLELRILYRLRMKDLGRVLQVRSISCSFKSIVPVTTATRPPLAPATDSHLLYSLQITKLSAPLSTLINYAKRPNVNKNYINCNFTAFTFL